MASAVVVLPRLFTHQPKGFLGVHIQVDPGSLHETVFVCLVYQILISINASVMAVPLILKPSRHPLNPSPRSSSQRSE